MRRRGAAALAVLIWAMALPSQAAGLFFGPRGLRPLAQAGAYVAAPADLYALVYNPAGLADAAPAVLVDAATPLHFSRVEALGGGPPQHADGRGLGLPSPTFGVVHGLGLPSAWRFGAAVAADYPALQKFAAAVNQPAAFGRYGAADFYGTAFGRAIVGAAWRPLPQLAVGLAAQLLLGRLVAQTVVSACDGVFCVQPENPSYDVPVQLRSGLLAQPGLHAGLQLRPRPWLQIGLAFETGALLEGDASLALRLPAAPLYADARIEPATPQARLRLRLPYQARLGVALAPPDAAYQLQAAAVYEPWSVHDAIDIAPQQVSLTGLLGVDRFVLPPLRLARNFENSGSLRLGGAYRPALGGDSLPLTVRGGLLYERRAVPNAALQPQALSLDGLWLSMGMELQLRRWTLLAAVAHGLFLPRTVTSSGALQANALGAAERAAIGYGTYRAHANLIGLGLSRAL